MIRLLMYLLGKETYEPCKGCEVLKQQLAIANAEKKEAIDTVISIIKPKAITPVELNKTAPIAGVFSRRQGFLEEQDRKQALASRSTFAAGNQVKPNPAEVQEAVNEIEQMVEAAEGKG